MGERWSQLREIVDGWYQDDLRSAEDLDGFDDVEPLALREWFQLVGDRIQSGFLQFPELDSLQVERRKIARGRKGLLRVIHDGSGHAGWGIEPLDSSDDPRVHVQSPDTDAAELVFDGPLSALLTYALISETLSEFYDEDSGPLGELGDEVYRLSEETLIPSIDEYLEDLSLVDVPLTTPGNQWRLLANAEGTLHVWQECAGGFLEQGQYMGLIARGPQAWDPIERLLEEADEQDAAMQRAERRRRDEEKAAQVAELGGPGSAPELLEALEAIEDRLKRFEKAFLGDLRLSVKVGSVTEGQKLKAAQILEKRR